MGEPHHGKMEVLEYTDRDHLEYARPRSFAEEVVFSEKKYPVTPYNLPEQYNRISRDRIVSSKKLETNIKTVFFAGTRKMYWQTGRSSFFKTDCAGAFKRREYCFLD